MIETTSSPRTRPTINDPPGVQGRGTAKRKIDSWAGDAGGVIDPVESKRKDTAGIC